LVENYRGFLPVIFYLVLLSEWVCSVHLKTPSIAACVSNSPQNKNAEPFQDPAFAQPQNYLIKQSLWCKP
jgi:hypothetical protein